jgi:hypothetical protein
MFMVRKVTHLLVLPLLFALLSVGGRVTLCEVLSLVGLEGHHHSQDEGRDHSGPVCLESGDHDQGHDEVPCPESCEIRLSEATAPVLLKVPAVSESFSLPCLLERLLATGKPVDCLRAVEKREPPDHLISLIDSTFTSRFQI